MQDSENDPGMSLPVIDHNAAVGVLAENKTLVAATLAAIVLAGSAIVYRTRKTDPVRATVVGSSTRVEQGSVMATTDLGEMEQDEEERGRVTENLSLAGSSVNVAGGEDHTSLPSSLVLDPDAAKDNSKSSRSKDRRKRGKDPLREVLKSTKKLKAFPMPSPLSATHPSFGEISTPTPRGNQFSDSGSVASSSNSRRSPSLSLHAHHAQTSSAIEEPRRPSSRSAGKRPQRDISSSRSITISEADDQPTMLSIQSLPRKPSSYPDNPSVHSATSTGTTSAGHSRTTSEVSQTHHASRVRQYGLQVFDETSQFITEQGSERSGRGESEKTPFGKRGREREVPIYDRDRRMQTRSASSRVSFSEDDEAEDESSLSRSRLGDEGLGEEGTKDDSHSAHRLGDEEPILRRFGQERETADLQALGHSRGEVVRTGTPVVIDHPPSFGGFESGESAPSSRTTATNANTADFSSSDALSFIPIPSSTSSDPSGGPLPPVSASTSSSTTPSLASETHTNAQFAPSASITPATSPTLSTSTSLNPTSPFETPETTMPLKKARKAVPQPPSKASKQSPWDWDGAGDLSSAPHGAHDTMKEQDTPKQKDKKSPKAVEHKPNRNTSYASFSSAVASGLPPSASHPGASSALNSPIKAGFGTSSSAPALSDLGRKVGSTSDSTLVDVSDGGHELGDEREKEDEGFTYPTLNPTPVGPSRTRSSADTPSSPSTTTTVTPSNSKKSRRSTPPSHKNTTSSASAPPHRTTSPSSSSRQNRDHGHIGGNGSGGMPALSTQTQLASLRGALEAARLREEKHKAEMEKVTKELEVLKWESTNSRRGEAELQVHIRHLTHQLQSYYAFLAGVAPHLSAQFQQQVQHHLPPPPPPLPLALQHQQQGNGNANPDNDVDAQRTEPAAPISPIKDQNVPSSDDQPSAAPQQQDGQPSSVAATQSPSSTSNLQAQPQTETSTRPQSPPQASGQQTQNLPLNLTILSSPPLAPTMPSPSPLSANGPGVGHAIPPPPITSPGPSPFFPYPISPYLHANQPPMHPMQHLQWMQHLAITQQQHQNSGSGPIPQSPRHATPMFSPVMFPVGPYPPVPPQPMMSPPIATGIMSPHQLHHAHSFGHGLNRSGPSSTPGTSSAGSMSPDMAVSPGVLALGGKKRPRVQRTRSQMSNVSSGHGKSAIEDVVDGWYGLTTTSTSTPGRKASSASNSVVDEPTVGSGGEDDEGTKSPFSDLLADAILKRPGSIRGPSMKKGGNKDGMDILQQRKGSSEGEELTEFTFPSLSDMGNSYYRSTSRTESSISSSLSSSPPSSTATVPDSVPDFKMEDEKVSLAPVVENVEDVDAAAGDAERELTFCDARENRRRDDVTPRKEDHTGKDVLEQPPIQDQEEFKEEAIASTTVQ